MTPRSVRPRRSSEIACRTMSAALGTNPARSEEHTSELQSRSDLVCRLLLEKKKKIENLKLVRSQNTENRDHRTQYESRSCPSESATQRQRELGELTRMHIMSGDRVSSAKPR